MSEQDILAKMNQIKRFIEIDSMDFISVRSIGDFFHLDYYITEEDKTPYTTKKIHKGTVEDLNWVYVVLLLNQTKGESEAHDDQR